MGVALLFFGGIKRMEVLDGPPTVEDFPYLAPGALPILPAQRLAPLAQIVVGRFFLLHDAIGCRVGLAPLVPMPISVPDLVFESTPITGHKTPPLRNNNNRRMSVTNLSGNKPEYGCRPQLENPPCGHGGFSQRLGTFA